MGLKVIVTPNFNVTELMHNTVGHDWTQFQLHAFNTGKALLKYMQTFITANHKRVGGKGTLAKAMTLDILSTTGKIHWGIGHIPTLNQRAKGFGGRPYWYVVNYGKKVGGQPFIPGGGKYRPVLFTDGPADSSKRGKGTGKAIKFRKIKGDEPKPEAIRPMNYIEATYKQLQSHVLLLVSRFKRS